MNKNTVFSFSGGKDSCLAVYRALKEGYEPISLITTYNKDGDRSWFHGIPKDLLKEISQSMSIPVSFMETSMGDDYSKAFEDILKDFKSEKDVNTCVFGDIDIEDHLNWCKERCETACIDAIFPLWQESRESLVKEFIRLGFKAIITLVNRDFLGEYFLGKELTLDLLEEIESEGADICGENGEYHTFVFDGPIFSYPVNFETDEIKELGKYSALPIVSVSNLHKTHSS